MKKILLGASAATLLAVPVIALYAHEDGKMPMMMPDMTRAQMEARVKEMFAAADANKDGVVTQDEMKARMEDRRDDRIEEHFKAMDKNADGSISHDEFVAAHQAMEGRMGMAGHGDMSPPPPAPPAAGSTPPPAPPPPPMMHGGMDMKMGMKMGERMFDKADANNDGKVTLGEAMKAANTHFDAMDADKNGTVTAGERLNYMKARMKDWKGGGNS